MAKVKKGDLKNMSKEDLTKRMKELNKELMKLMSQVHTGTAPENPGRIRAIKRMIARILTIQKNQKEEKSKA